MNQSDPLAALAARGRIAALAEQARADLAAVHRRPAVLRKPAIIAGEAAVRGARLSALIDGHPLVDSATREVAADSPLAHALSAYSLVAPSPVVDRSVATWLRAPAQLLAQLDVRAGGRGRPVTADGAHRLRTLGAVILAPGIDGTVATQVVHGEIAGHGIFGPRSGLVARVAARVSAVASGFDPAGLAVPEVFYSRHRARYEQMLAAFGDGDGVVDAVEFFLEAWIAGAAEGAAIVEAA